MTDKPFPDLQAYDEEVKRLRAINAELVNTANTYLLVTMRQEDEIKRLRALAPEAVRFCDHPMARRYNTQWRCAVCHVEIPLRNAP
jgi:hypothetical protein